MAIFPVTRTVTTRTVTRTSSGAQDIAVAAVTTLVSSTILAAVGWFLYKLEAEPAFELGSKAEHQWGATPTDRH